MREDIFRLLMLVLLLENGGRTEYINQIVIMFLLMNSNSAVSQSSRAVSTCHCGGSDCGRADGFTF